MGNVGWGDGAWEGSVRERKEHIMRMLATIGLATLACAGPALGSPEFYDTVNDFASGVLDAGKVSKGSIDFENNTAAPNDAVALGAILDSNPNGPFILGIGLPNVAMSASGFEDLVLLTEGALGVPSDMVGARFTSDSTILAFSSMKTGIAFEVYEPTDNEAPVDITVFNMDVEVIGMVRINQPGTEGQFVGIIDPGGIGAIRIEGLFDPLEGEYGGEMIDNISMWEVPAPGAAALLGLGGLLAGRRGR